MGRFLNTPPTSPGWCSSIPQPKLLGAMPLVVLTHGLDAPPDQQAAHAAIAKLSRNSRHTAVPGSYHEIHLSHPEAVVAAILDVVSAVRERRPLR